MGDGAMFLVRDADVGAIFTPEEFTSEERSLARTAREFIEKSVLPVGDVIEAKDFELSVSLFRQAGELGLLMAEVDEEYGGLGLNKTTGALIYENLCGQTSFQTFCGVHSSIGSLPIGYYGTPAQKEKYLTRLATGELIGCYCLTEATAGSDALACRTKAVLSEDGKHYVLNGVKQFITNGGLADVFTVFAKVDGAKFTAFIVERGTPGLSTGAEEHKLGIRGSSTTQVILDDALVPVENVLGEVGEGHKIAFNILNFGRVKLGVQAHGYCRLALTEALNYARERKQFGKSIASFGALREKFARMYANTWALEAASYRTLGHIDAEIEAGSTALAAGEEYRIECALVKVLGTEILDYVVDEALQCLGGYGYCSEYPLERYYRDARINRIYEGTNEINRVFAASLLAKMAAEGALDPAEGSSHAKVGDGLDSERATLRGLKAVTVELLKLAAQKLGRGLGQRQDVLMRLADLAMRAYFAESALVRASKSGSPLNTAAARVFCDESWGAAAESAREALCGLCAGEELEARLATLATTLKRPNVNVMELREFIASSLVGEV